MKIAQHNGNTLTFDPSKHTYTDQTQRQYTSVTQVVQRLFPAFNQKQVASKISESSGLPPEHYIKLWQDKANKASKFGNWCHYYAEATLKNYPVIPIPHTQRHRQAKANIDRIIRKHIKNKTLIDCELIVFSRDLFTAGTIDLLMRDDDTLYICDWKSNEDLDLTNKFNQFGYEMFRNVPASKFGHYSVQLNLYEAVLKKENYFPDITNFERLIFHIDGPYKPPIKVPDLQKQVKAFYGI